MFEQAFKNIDDVLWKDAGCTSELIFTIHRPDYTFTHEPSRHPLDSAIRQL